MLGKKHKNLSTASNLMAQGGGGCKCPSLCFPSSILGKVKLEAPGLLARVVALGAFLSISPTLAWGLSPEGEAAPLRFPLSTRSCPKKNDHSLSEPKGALGRIQSGDFPAVLCGDPGEGGGWDAGRELRGQKAL